MKPDQKARIPQGPEPDWRTIKCPTCNSKPGEDCMILLNGKWRDVAPHIDRHYFRENRVD